MKKMVVVPETVEGAWRAHFQTPERSTVTRDALVAEILPTVHSAVAQKMRKLHMCEECIGEVLHDVTVALMALTESLRPINPSVYSSAVERCVDDICRTEADRRRHEIPLGRLSPSTPMRIHMA